MRCNDYKPASFLSTHDTSEQASYRLLRLFSKVRAHSFRCSSSPNRTRCAGLRFGFGCGPGGRIFFGTTAQSPSEILYFRGAFYIQKARHASLPLPAGEICCAAAAMEKQRENTEIIGLVSAKTVPIPHIGWRQWADSSRQCRSPGCGGPAENRERHRCHCPQRRRPRERRR